MIKEVINLEMPKMSEHPTLEEAKHWDGARLENRLALTREATDMGFTLDPDLGVWVRPGRQLGELPLDFLVPAGDRSLTQHQIELPITTSHQFREALISVTALYDNVSGPISMSRGESFGEFMHRFPLNNPITP